MFMHKIETLQVEYESTINSNEEEIKRLKNTILKQDAELLSFSTELIRRKDVEEQLRIAREHEKQMEEAKN